MASSEWFDGNPQDAAKRLSANRKSLLDTEALFAEGRTPGDDLEASMLLNHKNAIEFMVDAVPEYGITIPVVRNIQSLLMQGLLENPDLLGSIRQTVVNITDSVYVPTQIPNLPEEILGIVVDKANYEARYHRGDPISSAGAEGVVGYVIGQRMKKTVTCAEADAAQTPCSK